MSQTELSAFRQLLAKVFLKVTKPFIFKLFVRRGRRERHDLFVLFLKPVMSLSNGINLPILSLSARKSYSTPCFL